MHEYSITQTLVDLLLQKIEKLKNPIVKRVYIELGCLIGYDPESISYYFGFLSKNTPLESAELDFEIKEIRVECEDCGNKFFSKELLFSCPVCNSNKLKLLSGEEFLIKFIEVEYGEN